MINVIEIEGMKDLIEAIGSGGGGSSDVPEPTSADRGKFLGVSTDSNNLEYRAAKELPISTSGDEGKVLTVDSNGDAEWAPPSGGGVTVYGCQTPQLVKTEFDFETSQQIAYVDVNTDTVTTYSDTGKTIPQANDGDLIWVAVNNYNVALCIIKSVIDKTDITPGLYRLMLYFNTTSYAPSTYIVTNAPAPKSVPSPSSSDIGKTIICKTSTTNGYVEKNSGSYPTEQSAETFLTGRVIKGLKTTGATSSRKLNYLRVTVNVRLTDADGTYDLKEIDISSYVYEYTNGSIALPFESVLLDILEMYNKMWDETHAWTNKEITNITYYYA